MSRPPESQPRTLRFALVGCGTIASTQAKVFAAIDPQEAVLTTFCDLEDERAQKIAQEFGGRAISFEEMLRDPEIEAVTLCTPSGTHAAQAVACLNAGKHVLIEKPMDVSLEACDAVVKAQEISGRTLSVISQHRYDPASERVHAAIESGELGTLFLAEARIPWYRSQEYYDSGDWRGTWSLDGGGCLMNQGIHTLDLFR